MQTIFLCENLNYTKKLFNDFTKNLKSTQPQIIHCSKLMWINLRHTLYTQNNGSFSFYNF